MKNIIAKVTGRFFKTLLVFILIAAGCLIAYFIYNPKKAITLVFPDLDRISYVDAVIKNDSAFTKLSVVLENKNPYKLVIDTLAFEVRLNDTSIAYQKIALNLDQSRFDVDTVKLPLNLSIKKIHGIIRNLQDQDSTNFQTVGYVVYETIFGRMKLDFDRKKRILVPVPPKLKVVKVERKGFSLKDKILKADATIEIINGGKYIDIQLIGVHYDLSVKNTLHASGDVNRTVTIKPQSSVTVVIPMEIEVYHPLKAIWLIKTDNDRLPYSLHLKGIVKENVSENSFASPTELTATGMMELKK